MKVSDIIEKEITFEGNRINGNALNTLYDFSINKFFRKTRPGIGVTTALLNYQNGNLIIISPLTPMIQKKAAGQYESDRQFFKCTGIDSNWSTVLDYLQLTPIEEQNMIINTTPDAICGLHEYNEELFNELIKMPVVVDEYDTVVLQSQLREECGRFLEFLYSKWQNTFTFSTATPNYRYIDVPEPTQIEFFSVGPIEPHLMTLAFSKDFKDALKFIQTELEEGRKVACFSNNLKVHKKKFSKFQKSMAGENLTLRLEYYNVETGIAAEDDLFKDHNMVVFSGKYYVGYDIDEDVSVVIISEANHPATTTGVNMAVQALHRCRRKIINALYINSRLNSRCIPDNETVLREQKVMISEIQHNRQKASFLKWPWEIKKGEPITPELACNRAWIAAKTINKISWMQLHDEELMAKAFNAFGLILVPYSAPEIELLKDQPIKFNERMLNCMNVNTYTMQSRYDKARSRLRFSNQGSHNPHRAMERLTALLIGMINYEELTVKLDNQKLKPKKFYTFFDKFLQKNYPVAFLAEEIRPSNQSLSQILTIPVDKKRKIDEKYIYQWHLYYASFKINKNELPPAIQRYIDVRSTAGNMDILQQHQESFNRIELAFRDVQQKLGSLSSEEEEKVRSIISKRYSCDENRGFGVYSVKGLKSNILNAIFFLINPELPLETTNGRQTNPLTKLFRVFRPLIPIEMILIDIQSANAQFIDKIIDSQMADSVYQNIMVNQALERKNAKTQFSHICNCHYLGRDEAIDYFHKICGYPLNKAEALAALTTNVDQGSFYRRMTKTERDIIKLYNQTIGDVGLRLHDGLVVFPWELPDPISVRINDVKFSVTYFRNDSPFVGKFDENNKIYESFLR